MNTTKWEKFGKTREYFNSGYLRKGNSFFVEKDEKSNRAKYKFAVTGGFVYTSKVYNGAIEEELNEIFDSVEFVK